MIVMKFGGTSVADRAAIERLIAIVRAARQAAIQPESTDWRGPIVVVSALGGVTDRLLGVAAEAGAGDVEGAHENIRALEARHLEVARVIVDDDERHRTEHFIRDEFAELERIAGALGVLREVTPRWLDAIAATGEILSSRMVAAALSSHGLAASWVDARRAIVTTTLGRGGSDYSAAIVGASLGADEIQIWTDVDGMLTADPRIVRDVQVVPHLSFAEASELAYFGAKVLHPATIQPAVARNIPVRILNSRRPEDPVGTLITRERPPSASPLTAVASKTGVTVVDITSTRMLMAHGFLRRIFEVFEQHRISVDVVTTSEVSVSVTIDDARRVPEAMETLRGVADVTREDGMAILCAVGEGLQDDPAVVRDLL